MTPGIGFKNRLAPSSNVSAAFGLSGSVQKITTCENMAAHCDARAVSGKSEFPKGKRSPPLRLGATIQTNWRLIVFQSQSDCVSSPGLPSPFTQLPPGGFDTLAATVIQSHSNRKGLGYPGWR